MEGVEPDEDEEEVVVLGDAGCAAMRAAEALRAAAASPVATAGRMEGMSSGRGIRACGWTGPAATWRPCGPIWLAAVCGGGVGLRSPSSGPAALGSCNARERARQRPRGGGDSSRRLHSGSGRVGSGVSGLCAGGVCGLLGRVGVPWGVQLFAAAVCRL